MIVCKSANGSPLRVQAKLLRPRPAPQLRRQQWQHQLRRHQPLQLHPAQARPPPQHLQQLLPLERRLAACHPLPLHQPQPLRRPQPHLRRTSHLPPPLLRLPPAHPVAQLQPRLLHPQRLSAPMPVAWRLQVLPPQQTLLPRQTLLPPQTLLQQRPPPAVLLARIRRQRPPQPLLVLLQRRPPPLSPWRRRRDRRRPLPAAWHWCQRPAWCGGCKVYLSVEFLKCNACGSRPEVRGVQSGPGLWSFENGLILHSGPMVNKRSIYIVGVNLLQAVCLMVAAWMVV